MSRGQTLRALVNARLVAAAEEIFGLFERTIAEYEEELCRSKEQNQRKLLDKVLSPRSELVSGNVQIPSLSPGPSLNQKITETPWIKEEPEEQSVKQEEEQLPVPVPESCAICVKIEETSLLQQRQTEHREETQGEDISSEPHFHSETERHTDNDDHWEPFSCTTAKSTGLCPRYKSAAETTVQSGHMSGADRGAKRKKHQCFVCNKRFRTKQVLQTHFRVHTGERPYSCSVCEKTFALKSSLTHHRKTHSKEKPYICSICKKAFNRRDSLDSHIRTHTGEKPHSCSICKKAFALKWNLDLHERTHTGEKPYSCSTCDKRFTRKGNLNVHMRTHTGEKPFICTVCNKAFSKNFRLKSHMSVHRGQSI